MAIPVLSNGHTPEADWIARKLFGRNQYLLEPTTGPFAGKIYHLGILVCRQIAGSSSWSDHAFGAGLDVGVKSAYRTKPFFDEVKAYIEDLADGVAEIRYILSWTTSHYDHLHLSVGPKPSGTPPCAGGPQGPIVQPWPLDNEEDFLMALTEAQQEQVLADAAQIRSFVHGLDKKLGAKDAGTKGSRAEAGETLGQKLLDIDAKLDTLLSR